MLLDAIRALVQQAAQFSSYFNFSIQGEAEYLQNEEIMSKELQRGHHFS